MNIAEISPFLRDAADQYLRAYIDLGIQAFILSGYPHAQECDYVGRYILPQLATAPLAVRAHEI